MNFQDLLNRVPSQMPGAMGGGAMGVGMGAGFDHGITGNLSDIQSRPIDYGVQGGPQQMPVSGMIPGMAMGNMAGTQIAQGQGGFNIFNPFTYGNMKKAIDKTRAGDENVEYSDSVVGGIGKAANERNRMMQEMLQGY